MSAPCGTSSPYYQSSARRAKKDFFFLVDFFTRAAADFVEKEEMLFVYRKEEKLSAFCYQSSPLKLLRGIYSISYG